MFNIFGRKTRQSTAPPVLYFKSGRAFWEYQCQFGNTATEKNVAVVALVVDAQKELGTPTPISIAQDSSQLAALLVASDDGGFLIYATTPSVSGEKLVPDDVVLWVPAIYATDLAEQMADKRSGWIGTIRAKVKPEIRVADPSLVIACRYD